VALTLTGGRTVVGLRARVLAVAVKVGRNAAFVAFILAARLAQRLPLPQPVKGPVVGFLGGNALALSFGLPLWPRRSRRIEFVTSDELAAPVARRDCECPSGNEAPAGGDCIHPTCPRDERPPNG
jgi:hypothetical protein